MNKSSNKKKAKISKRLPDTAQGALFKELPQETPKPSSTGLSDFHCPSPEAIFIGETSLRTYLQRHDRDWIIRLRENLEALDWSEFTTSYDSQGRKPFHPIVMMGLTLYGILNRHSSLRELESLARLDVGAWWLTGGLQPDHSTIGNFLVRHQEILSESFFLSLTGDIIKRLRLRPDECAGDGTVIEAAASRYRRLSAEAAKEAAHEARERADKSPDDPEAHADAKKAETTSATVKERSQKAKANGNSAKAVFVNPAEPEAVFQPQKNGTRRFGYKPSVTATPERLIVGQDVQPSDENASVEPLLDQYQVLMDEAPTRTMWDGNYHNGRILGVFAERELDALCPSGPADLGRWKKSSPRGKFPKEIFSYDADQDEYRCPTGGYLIFVGAGKNQSGIAYRRYGKGPCAECEQRGKCTTSPHGRTIKRYAADPLKEIMTQVMAQPAARKAYKRRKGMVEPVFAELRERFGLKRFRRRGLAGVRLEFALYCSAYNLKRAWSLLGALRALLRQIMAFQTVTKADREVLAAV
jgi:transposase